MIFSRTRYRLGQFSFLILAFGFIAIPTNAQSTVGDDEGNSSSGIVYPRTFLIKQDVVAETRASSDASATGTSARDTDAAGGSAGQSSVPGVPVTFTSVGRNAPRRQEITLINFGPKYINALFGGFEQGGGFGFPGI